MAYEEVEVIDIEVAHIYSGESLGEDQLKTIFKLKELKYTPTRVSVLIDDFHGKADNVGELQIQLKEIIGENVFIKRESDFINLAFSKIKTLPEGFLNKEYKEGREFWTVNSNGKNIVLMYENQGQIVPSCALLSFCWVMYRSGHKDYKGDVVPHKIVTILPKKYRSVENKVIELLKVFGQEEVLGKLEYFFL